MNTRERASRKAPAHIRRDRALARILAEQGRDRDGSRVPSRRLPSGALLPYSDDPERDHGGLRVTSLGPDRGK